MFYYENNGEYVEKKEMVLEAERLKELKKEICKNCSKVVHIERTDTKCYVNPYDYDHIKNFRKKKQGVRSYNDFYSEDEDVYLFSYDEYVEPLLGKLIGDLLAGKNTAYNEIINYNLEEDTSLDEEIVKREKIKFNLLNEEIRKSLEVFDVDHLININDIELAKLKERKELNKNQKSIKEYYSQVLECITFKTVARIKSSILSEVNEFYKASDNVSKEEKGKSFCKK